MKRYITFFIKIFIAAGLMTWLVRSGKMNFSIISESFSAYPERWILSFCALILMEFIIIYRWKMVLDLKSESPTKYFDILRLTYIGLFFNPLLPGAVSGDAVKVYYAKDLDPELKPSYLLTSVFFDRVIGLTGLLTMMGIIMLIKWDTLFSFGKEMQALLYMNLFFLSGILGFLIFIFAPNRIQLLFRHIISRIPLVGQHLIKVLDSLWIVGAQKLVVIKALICSMAAQSIGMFVFWYLTSPYFNKPLAFEDFYTIVPIGFITISIPITPMGIGVGNAVFDKLFAIYGVSGGASLFNFKLLLMIMFYMLGVIPYLTHKKKFNLDDLEKVSQTS